MINPAFEVTITDPYGSVLDVTARLTVVGSLTETLEEDLLELTHSDISIEAIDTDGKVEAFLRNAEPADEYRLTIDRETGKRRPKWDRVFTGILDLPWSVSFDRRKKTVSVQAFGLSKLLERASGEDVARTYSGETGTVTAASDQLTLSDTTGLEAGDEITLTDAANEETQTIESVDSGVLVTTVEVWDDSFTGADATLETPYYRNKDIRWLAEQLFDTAEIGDYDIDTANVQADSPFASQIAADGLSGTIRSIVDEGGEIKVVTSANKYRSPGIGHAFEVEDASTTAQRDWYPYLDAEPASILAYGTADEDSVGVDHTNAYRFTLLQKNPSGNNFQLWIQRNGIDWYMVDSLTDTLGLGYTFGERYIEWEPTNQVCWVSFEREETGAQYLKYSDGVSVTTISSGAGSHGHLRRVNSDPPRMGFLAQGGTGIAMYDLDFYGPTSEGGAIPATAKIWHIKAFDCKNRVAIMYTEGGSTYVRVWTLPDWTLEGNYKVSTSNAAPFFMAPFNTGTECALIGYGGGQWFAVSRVFGGIIPYADFEGLSVGAALKQLAILSAAYVTVDRYGTGYLRARSNFAPDGSSEPVDVGTPLDRETMLLTEAYRSQIVVSGEDQDGEEVKVIVGEAGDSAHSLAIDSVLITNAILADAIGNTYRGLLSALRTEENITVSETGTILHPLSQVFLDSKLYDLLEVETDFDDRTADLRLVEAI